MSEVAEDSRQEEVFAEATAAWSNPSLSAEQFLEGWICWLQQNTDTQLQVIINNREIPEEMRRPAIAELERRWKGKVDPFGNSVSITK
jgi:hypothetical protein